MLTETHKAIASKIWEIANRLRGPYRPPQYRLVMLPMVVLRRFDCVLEPTKDAVVAEHARLIAAGTPERAIPKLLSKIVDPARRRQPLYNTSPYTFAKLLDDSENIAPNLVAYINGFSETARAIFDRFKFSEQIEKLDASNRLFNIVKAMADVDLHPDAGIDNLQMGYLFEYLVMKFNEQANEEAGDHFTPREVIRLMTHLLYTGEEDVYKPGVYREIYDPACGTGGMLSVSEETIRAGNEKANLGLYGQEYNDESWAICCSDMLIKDEDTDNVVLGDTLGDGKTFDGFPEKKFHYMLANLLIAAKSEAVLAMIISLICDFFHEHPAGPFDLKPDSRVVGKKRPFEFLGYAFDFVSDGVVIEPSHAGWERLYGRIVAALDRDLLRDDEAASESEIAIRDSFSGYSAWTNREGWKQDFLENAQVTVTNSR